MKKFFIFLLLLPAILILTLAVFHRIRVKTSIPASVLMKKTQAEWDKGEMVAIGTNAQFMDRVSLLPIHPGGSKLSAQQQQTLHEAVRNMILANYLGSYSNYWNFLVPVEKYRVCDGVAEDLSNDLAQIFPGEPAPGTFKQLDGKIWDHNFGGQPYWTSINLNNLNITLVVSNRPPVFTLKELDSEGFYAPGGTKDSYIDYDDLMGNIIAKTGSLNVAKISVMVTTIDSKSPRPIYYVLVEDPVDQVWLPVETGYLYTKMLKKHPHF